MYHKHNTEGIIIGENERGEASKNVAIFTREFGLIYASVQNGRALASKLRYGVQNFSEGSFVLVHGRNSWKLVGAESKRNIWTTLGDREKRRIAANIFSLLRKMVGEEKNEELYEIVGSSAESLQTIELEEAKQLEIRTVLQILKNQGLLVENAEDIENLVLDKNKAIKIINESLKASELVV